MRALLIALAATAIAGAQAPVVGELDVLVIRATWGPTTGTDEEARTALAEATRFFARASYGKLDVQFELTPWLRVYPSTAICPMREDEEDETRSALGPISRLARAGAAAAGYDVSRYARVVFLLPERVCGLPGLGVRREVLLAVPGGVDYTGVVHELGHTFGLPHAGAATCVRCRVAEYGDGLSPMGRGFSDFSTWEKSQLGWLADLTVARRSGTYTIADADQPSATPQALVVPTRAGEFWIEYRTVPRPELVVRLVRTTRQFAQATLLARVRSVYRARGFFTVRRVRGDGAAVAVRLNRR